MFMYNMYMYNPRGSVAAATVAIAWPPRCCAPLSSPL